MRSPRIRIVAKGRAARSCKTLWDRLSLRRQEIAKVAFPQIVKKRQTVLNASLDNKILGLYGLGMSYQDISSHLNLKDGLD
ncbi:hypothetical protein IM40_05820 [Candidatus Paracaedimonas acanthamoebae]|nr:hypothetical protein IM40_05820 [Candidatus Paracaedimonas acanthamoebae]